VSASVRRWGPWLVLAVVLVAALVVGARPKGGPESLDDHVRRVASQVRCPTCDGQSVANSDADASQAIRQDIHDRILQGQSDQQILAFIVSRYGRGILLKPPASGFSGLVWTVPVVAFVLAVAGLAVAFRRWRARPGAVVSDADEALVQRALGNPS
jgi:cytochrome c-type biogenesis protein CcmH